MVHVINEAGIPIHDGIEPEARIIEEMDQALDVLNDESREPLLRIALFHFLLVTYTLSTMAMEEQIASLAAISSPANTSLSWDWASPRRKAGD